MNRGWMIALTVLWVLIGAASVLLSMMSFFMFDAPGSDQSRLTWLAFYFMITMPAFWIIGAGLPWCFLKKKWAGWLFAFPAIDIAAIVIIFMCIGQFCGGQFSCR